MILKKINLNGEKAREFFFDKDFLGMSDFKSLLSRGFDVPFHYESAFLKSDLYIALNHLFEGENAVVDGKYKDAKLYLFETDNLYISALSEQSDNGSSWLFVEKSNNGKQIEYSGEVRFLRLSEEIKNEFSEAMQELMYNVLLVNKKHFDMAKKYFPDFTNQLFFKFDTLKNMKIINAELPQSIKKTNIKM